MIRLFLRLIIAYITIQIKILLFFIKHFEITNSLLTGLFADMLINKLDLNVWFRIGVIVVIAAASFLLQYFFIPARILFGAISSFICGAIAYAVFKDNSYFSPYIPMAIVTALVGVLNWLGWKKRTEPVNIDNF